MLSALRNAGVLTITFILFSFTNLAQAQPYSFVGLGWGDTYEVVNEKLTTAGFSKMLELVIHQREPINAPKLRLFESGRLLGHPARGAVFFVNNTLIGVHVNIASDSKSINKVYDEVESTLRQRYGRSNLTLSSQRAEWGNKDRDSVELYSVPENNEVLIFYKSTQFKTLQKQGIKNEAAKF